MVGADDIGTLGRDYGRQTTGSKTLHHFHEFLFLILLRVTSSFLRDPSC